ncbi:MAG: DUF1569 domain-containing protein [Emticicia sp.]|uniref:DUF1569 domain-containing protein n=1 Tax=Emticicia sp. TaxID=1930953 RepID=UPI003BA6A86E
MALPNIFKKSVSEEVIGRINALTPSTQGKWGKMSVSQMLAHCNVSYELIYENKHPKPNAFMKFILKLLVKNKVVSEEPYSQNGQTAPQFVVKEDKDFEIEKNRLINYIRKTQELGENYFDGKESHSFGALNITEWNNLFYKHLNHHLTQFGV